MGPTVRPLHGEGPDDPDILPCEPQPWITRLNEIGFNSWR
jgi:hypothetical protein